jgi:hypothetical protein
LSGNTLLEDGTHTYYAAQLAGECQSSSRTPVQVTVSVNGLPAPEAERNQVVCKTNATVADLRATGSRVIWFLDPVGGDALALNTRLNNGETYFAAQSSGSCESSERAAVTVYINPSVTITSQPANQFICAKNTPLVNLSVSAQGQGTIKYQWYENGQPLSGATSASLNMPLTSGFSNTYYVTASNECQTVSSASAVIARRLDVIVQKRNHTLAVNNNPATNGGYTFVSYTWYKGDQVIQPELGGGINQGGYYHIDGQELDMYAEYYVVMKDAQGHTYYSCPFTPDRVIHNSISVYPNPLAVSQLVYVNADLEDSALENAVIEIYSSLGSYIGRVKAERLTPIRLPEEKGVYILKFRSSEREENFKIIVK